MTTTFSYINLASSMIATMVAAGINPMTAAICILWLALATWHAHRTGILEDTAE